MSTHLSPDGEKNLAMVQVVLNSRKKHAEIEEKRAELEAKKQEMLNRLDK